MTDGVFVVVCCYCATRASYSTESAQQATTPAVHVFDKSHEVY
jgi:hypothetical protein